MDTIRTAVILCGGEGTRLRPLTNDTPKVLIEVRGKPVLEHIFDLLKRYQVRDVILSVGYLREKIKEHFSDGSGFGLSIRYLEEETPLGTAGPLRLLKSLDMLPGETFIASNGDELKEINIREMLAEHRRNIGTATLALTRVEDPSQYGVAKLDGSRILEFVEKPGPGEAPSNLINAGFYMMEPDIAGMIPGGFSLLEKDVFPVLAGKGKLFSFPFDGQWFDTGNFERLERARREWKGLS